MAEFFYYLWQKLGIQINEVSGGCYARPLNAHCRELNFI